MNNFDFRQIAPRCGGAREAFEELCCQLAHRIYSHNRNYVRLRGDGGDGGVECFSDLPDGTRIGWQAKYVFDIDALLKQAGNSLETALKVHPTLTHYVLCFPFDLTGPTGRRNPKTGKPTKSQQEKFQVWSEKFREKAVEQGRELNIEIWTESKLRALILDLDISGGIREFFFNETILNKEWFQNHLSKAEHLAGSRYTPELNVQTDLWKSFSALCRTYEWSEEFEEKIRLCRQASKQFSSQFKNNISNIERLTKTENCPERVANALAKIFALKENVGDPRATNYGNIYEESCSELVDLLDSLADLETQVHEDLERQYGSGVDSAGFRQWMAEYSLSFPMSNLDCIRKVIQTYQGLCDWLRSPEGSLAFSHSLLITGVGWLGQNPRCLRRSQLSP